VSPPFDGAFARTETQPVAPDSKWTPDDPRWKEAARTLVLELEHFQEQLVGETQQSRQKETQVRLLLQAAINKGLIKTRAANNAETLALWAWQIVGLRFQRPEPSYPKNHEPASIKAYKAKLNDWQSALTTEIQKRHGKALKVLGIANLNGVVAALRRTTGPAPKALALAHRVYAALWKRSSREFKPAPSLKLNEDLKQLLTRYAPKPVLEKRLTR